MKRKQQINYKARNNRSCFNKFSNVKHINQALNVKENETPLPDSSDRELLRSIKWKIIETCVLLALLFVIISIKSA